MGADKTGVGEMGVGDMGVGERGWVKLAQKFREK